MKTALNGGSAMQTALIRGSAMQIALNGGSSMQTARKGGGAIQAALCCDGAKCHSEQLCTVIKHVIQTALHCHKACNTNSSALS